MTRVGRKPMATRHVQKLMGSARAKQRMAAILKTLSGQWTIAMACQRLGIHEAHFHALRQRWLHEALELLEPKRVGRPPQTERRMKDPQAERIAQLERELALAEARCEVAEVLGAAGPRKKGRVRS
jgi:hypothetical protein